MLRGHEYLEYGTSAAVAHTRVSVTHSCCCFCWAGTSLHPRGSPTHGAAAKARDTLWSRGGGRHTPTPAHTHSSARAGCLRDRAERTRESPATEALKGAPLRSANASECRNNADRLKQVRISNPSELIVKQILKQINIAEFRLPSARSAKARDVTIFTFS